MADERPVVKQRVSLTVGRVEAGETEAWEGGITDVTILARDLEENIWTVWDHTSRTIKMLSFDENHNWAWVEPLPEVMDDQD